MVHVVKDLAELKSQTSGKPLAIVDFYADWCGPCKTMKPIFEQLAHDHPDIVFLKVDVDQSGDLASKFNVSGIPSFVIIKNGDVDSPAQQLTGQMSA